MSFITQKGNNNMTHKETIETLKDAKIKFDFAIRYLSCAELILAKLGEPMEKPLKELTLIVGDLQLSSLAIQEAITEKKDD